MSGQDRQALRFLAAHLLTGLAGGLTFGIAILATNLGNLRTLAFESGTPVLAVGLLFFGLFVTFGSVAMGVGVMTLPEDDGSGR